ncbi:unnamed protein product [Acanthosepion pharaonis]|uniref:Uncharacterized protein n=1 Tax=Acanthosepion pharaonis TaxID=158019 RepID=A0A812DJ56_ACAPH|nr:unnamed protein product [Sepia pharaonis]
MSCSRAIFARAQLNIRNLLEGMPSPFSVGFGKRRLLPSPNAAKTGWGTRNSDSATKASLEQAAGHCDDRRLHFICAFLCVNWAGVIAALRSGRSDRSGHTPRVRRIDANQPFCICPACGDHALCPDECVFSAEKMRQADHAERPEFDGGPQRRNGDVEMLAP